jgi:hypothetical protein
MNLEKYMFVSANTIRCRNVLKSGFRDLISSISAENLLLIWAISSYFYEFIFFDLLGATLILKG